MAHAATVQDAVDVRFEDILAARERIAGGVFLTPCVESPALSAKCAARCCASPAAEPGCWIWTLASR